MTAAERAGAADGLSRFVARDRCFVDRACGLTTSTWRERSVSCDVMTEPLRRIPSASLPATLAWPGVTRQEAVAAGALRSGLASLAPGARTGWHHHGQHETSLYVLSGTVRLEFGRAGSRVLDCGPGDFIYVPGGTVHRESNPGSTEAVTVMTRAGEGESTYEADGPGDG